MWYVNYLLTKLLKKITVIEYGESLVPHSCCALTEGRERGSAQSGQSKTLTPGSSTESYAAVVTKVRQKECGALAIDR